MSQAVLVINAGSSSIKFAIYTLDKLDLLCRGQIAGIPGAPTFEVTGPLAARLVGAEGPPSSGNHSELTQWLLTKIELGLTDVEFRAAGHRVVHGGLRFDMPTLATPSTIAELERYCELVPNHQPHNLAAIHSVAKKWPDLAQYACFDTAFHRTQPRVAELFGLPRALTDEGIVRYGFHGLSYEYIASTLPQTIKERAAGKIIVAHLGHGASVCAMDNLQSVGTSMGFTALDGLMMANRCGNLDPGVVLYLIEHKGMTAAAVGDLLANQSGLLGVSGVSADVRELLASDASTAAEALDLFVYRAVREIGALVATMGGLDALVFTAGIGEHAPVIRNRITNYFAWLGADINEAANAEDGLRISSSSSKIDVLVIPTNEEIVIARCADSFL